MIRLFIGNVGSGKTLFAVRELVNNPSNKITFSNIKTYGLKNNITLKNNMIIDKEIIGQKKNGEAIYNFKANYEFWKQAQKKHGSLNIVIDEAHHLLNSRRSMSKINIVITEWLAMLRRVLSGVNEGYGTLTLISQLDYRLDVVARDMSTKISYFVMYYKLSCKKCGFHVSENNETPEKYFFCPRCNHGLDRHDFRIIIFNFVNLKMYEMFRDTGAKSYYSAKEIKNIEQYFKSYDTLQWDNLVSEY